MISTRTFHLASYHFFPQGSQEKILLEDEAAGVLFDFQEATDADKLYIQLFDQGFQYPPSKLYRQDAAFGQADVIHVTCRFETDVPCQIQLFKMQYGNKKRMGSESEFVMLDGATDLQIQLERVKGAQYFKIAFKVLVAGDVRIRLTELKIAERIQLKQEDPHYAV